MRKLYFILAVALLPLRSLAQDCNLDVDETDAFTKEHVKAGTNAVGGMMWHWKLTLKQKGETYAWAMQIKYGKHLPGAFRKGDVVYCKMKSGKVVKLISDDDYAPSHVVASDGFIITTYLPQGALTEADIKDFAESPMSEIRVTLSGKDLEPDISGKQGRNLQEIAQCILKK